MPTTADLTAALDQVEASVSVNTDAENSAIALLGQLNQLYKDALASGGTPQEVLDRVTALNSAIQSKTDVLAAAVVANTPTA